MKKMLAFMGLVSLHTFALTLADVQNGLKNSAFARDTIELRLTTTVNSVAGSQVSNVYYVQKGKEKIYTELKNGFMAERSIVNGNRMKVSNLKSGTTKVLPYNGEALHAMPFDKGLFGKGVWSEPKLVSGSEYVLYSDSLAMYYDAKKKRLLRFEKPTPNGYSETLFEYNANGMLSQMVTSVETRNAAAGKITVTTEIEKIRSAADFPDRFFEF